ncbi:hypothetical protein HY988_05560 [Candidatus Micrarchaeota archaeon]|nr:hypothetical protein [Candidatus Micrarchaeota archaeon]
MLSLGYLAMEHFRKLPLLIILLTIIILILGCTAPQTPTQNSPNSDGQNKNLAAEKPSDNGLPESDCLGLTAEKVQKTCGSGTLKRVVRPIKNGYECTYSAADPQGADRPDLGTELKLAYYTDGDDVLELKKAYQDAGGTNIVGEFKNGFYLVFPTKLALDRKGWAIEFFTKTKSLSTMLFGSEIDYEAMAMDPSFACSFSEMWELQSSISGENLNEQGKTELIKIKTKAPDFEAPPADGEVSAQANCCKIFIAEVKGVADKKSGNGNFEPLEKGAEINVGDVIVTDKDSSVVLYIVCSDDPDNAHMAIMQAASKWTIKGIEGSDIKIDMDPGVAHTSVKELEQFETDFQVSTPRLTCSVRG